MLQILIYLGYGVLFILFLAGLAFIAALIIIRFEPEPEDTDGDIDPELMNNDDDHQIFLNP